jgi:(1->4)-alpha-D-glucan 1-alpha-D-glucosylmutase
MDSGSDVARPGPRRQVLSTYRLQLHHDFGFAAAADAAGYLAALGVSHLYCSPYLQAAPGSTHGYDVSDPTELSQELGGAPAHAELVGRLRQVGLGQVLDIVPNHMAADPTANRWWWDVLENGPSSPFAPVFDIDSGGEGPRSAFTVLVPVLGDHYGRVLEAGELAVTRSGASFCVRYFDHLLPLSPRTLPGLLGRAARRAGSAELAHLADGFAALPAARLTDPAAVRQRHDGKEELGARLDRLFQDEPGTAQAVDAELDELNRDPDALDELMRRQNYRLAFWRVASEELDYRRFFNIDTLAGVRAEDPEVFELTHRLVLELVADGTVEGLRVDHVDGLRDPQAYLERLRERTAGCFTVVEKILESGEELPAWPVAGTSGYDFLNRVNNLFVDRAAEAPMTSLYQDFTGRTATYAEVVHDSKMHVMRRELAAEVERLTSLLGEICDAHRRVRDHTRRDLRDALRELVAHFPVYRTYVVPGQPPAAADRKWTDQAAGAARACRADIDAELIEFIASLGLGEHPGPTEADFAARLQQLTAPVMAKGVEDTAFYRYNRLVSLNEVGGDPGIFGRPVADFHRHTSAAAGAWPGAMLTLSTHDTKRSADVRARINALTEVHQAWARAVRRWSVHNQRHRLGDAPDPNDEYLLYQTLVGAWPLEPERALGFMGKAVREAKVHTSWTDPDPAYEGAVESFVRACLADAAFLADLASFLGSTGLVRRGRRNSLAQTCLLLTCPGVADIYQGTELWDLSLVDPDNRRPVDYGLRRRLRDGLGSRPSVDLADDQLGTSKMWLVNRLLEDRARRPHRYLGSDYEPLAPEGHGADRAVAYRRADLVVAALCGGLESELEGKLEGRLEGAGPVLRLPPGSWRDLLTGRPAGGTVTLTALLDRWPVAVLEPAG